MKTQIATKDYIILLKRKIFRRNITIALLALLLIAALILGWQSWLVLLMGIFEGNGLIN